jgi:hypothetical protein
MNHIYETIGNLYRAGSHYQTVVIQEIRTLFAGFGDSISVPGLNLPLPQAQSHNPVI